MVLYELTEVTRAAKTVSQTDRDSQSAAALTANCYIKLL